MFPNFGGFQVSPPTPPDPPSHKNGASSAAYTSLRKYDQVNIISAPLTLTGAPGEVQRKGTFQSHGGPPDGALSSQNVAPRTWENHSRDTDPLEEGFRGGGCQGFPVLVAREFPFIWVTLS